MTRLAVTYEIMPTDQLKEVLKRFGGVQAYAQAIDDCLTTLAGILAEPAQIRRLLLGDVEGGRGMRTRRARQNGNHVTEGLNHAQSERT